MDLLERYLNQIERYLPFKDREETIKELRLLILEELDIKLENGEPEETALFDIIKNMGEPREIASKYSNNRPMIGKELEQIMMFVIKICSITLPLVIVFSKTLAYLASTTDYTFVDILLNIAYSIPSAIYALLPTIGTIFIIFYLIERYFQPEFNNDHYEFNPNLLPELPTKEMKVSLFGSTLSILFTVLALYIFNLEKGLISIYYDGDRFPLLSSNFDTLLAYLNIGWFASIILEIFHMIKHKKTITSKTIESGLQIYGAIILILLATSNIFNTVIIEGYDLTIIPTIFKWVFVFLGIAIIIGTIVEYVKLFVNLEHLEELEKMSKSKKEKE